MPSEPNSVDKPMNRDYHATGWSPWSGSSQLLSAAGAFAQLPSVAGGLAQPPSTAGVSAGALAQAPSIAGVFPGALAQSPSIATPVAFWPWLIPGIGGSGLVPPNSGSGTGQRLIVCPTA